MPNKLMGTFAAAIGLIAASVVLAADTQPADSTTQPVSVDEAYQARIVKLAGHVQYALPEANGEPGEWQEAKVGDQLQAGTRIRTRLRSHVVLTFGDDTVVMIDRATLASIDQFHRSADTKHIRLGLGHGAVRAGVAETTLRSDMTIETPTATLSKKGTMDFGIEYEPSTGRYRVYLARQGLVEALDHVSGRSRTLMPGQYVTEAMVRWIETALFDRTVALADVFGMTGAERLFNALSGSGLGVLEPGGGQAAGQFAGSGGGSSSSTGSGGGLGTQPGAGLAAGAIISQLTGQRVITRPEGNFGTGNGRLPRLPSNR